MPRLLLALALLTLPLACAAPPPRPAPPTDPGPLLPYDALPTHALWRQRVTLTWPDGQQAFDAALQRTPDALTLVALSPLGPPAFVIRHDAHGVHITHHGDRKLPFAPSYMIADIQKALYPWLPPGTTHGTRHGLTITETRTADRLTHRRIDSPHHPEPITVTYTDPTITLHNGWLGYTLRVDTLEIIPLDPP